MPSGTKRSADPASSLLFADQASDPAPPASEQQRVFCRADGLYVIDESGAVVGPLGGSGTSYENQADVPPSSATVYDDEFDGGSLDAAWTEYKADAGAASSWTVGDDVAKLYADISPLFDDKPFVLARLVPVSGDWTFATKITSSSGRALNYQRGPGMALLESDATGKAATFTQTLYNSTLGYEKFGPLATRTSFDFGYGGMVRHDPLYMRVAKVGTTYTWSWSADGQGWTVSKVDSALGFTATKVGVTLWPGHATYPVAGSWEWFRKVA